MKSVREEDMDPLLRANLDALGGSVGWEVHFEADAARKILRDALGDRREVN